MATATNPTGRVTTKRTSKENQRKDKNNNRLMEIHTDARAKPITLS